MQDKYGFFACFFSHFRWLLQPGNGLQGGKFAASSVELSSEFAAV
jgi:hypothetical protein